MMVRLMVESCREEVLTLDRVEEAAISSMMYFDDIIHNYTSGDDAMIHTTVEWKVRIP
jgi:hypothetical protein